MDKKTRVDQLIKLSVSKVFNDTAMAFIKECSMIDLYKLVDLVIEDCSNIANAAMYDGDNGPDEVSRLIDAFVLPWNVFPQENFSDTL